MVYGSFLPPNKCKIKHAYTCIQRLMGGMLPKRTKMRHVKVKEAREILIQEESQKLIDEDAVKEEAIRRCEQRLVILLSLSRSISAQA